MSETAIVSSAPGDLHDGVRMSTTPASGSLLEQLCAAYQGLGREGRPEAKGARRDRDSGTTCCFD
jgi:hypothetical protein